MNFAAIKRSDIANGEGVRVTLFVSGCRNRCPGCFQPQTWDFSYGEPFTETTWEEIFDLFRKNPVLAGLTLLGGEPMEPENQRALLPFLRRFRAEFPDKTVWCFTGNLYEDLLGITNGHPEKHLDITEELLSLVDVLVDGPFVEAKARLGLRFRGSSNQRVIDMRKTRTAGHVVIWDGCREDKFYGEDKAD